MPVLFYAPGLIPAGERLNTLASLLYIPPTILGILGLEYDSKFFGQDLCQTDPTPGRALMMHNNVVALMRGEELAVLGLRGAATLYRYDRAAGKATPMAEPDSAGRMLLDDAIAYFHGADMLYRSGRYGFAAGAGGVAVGRSSVE